MPHRRAASHADAHYVGVRDDSFGGTAAAQPDRMRGCQLDRSRTSTRLGTVVPRVLVVDDDHHARSAVVDALELAGYGVHEAATAVEALASVEEGLRPSLIVLDLVMPGMDGWSLVAALRSSDMAQGIPVIVMTAHGETLLRSAPVSAGYLRKPVELEQLLDTVRRCIMTAAPSGS
jgi:CheY-like chemotaxis protein